MCSFPTRLQLHADSAGPVGFEQIRAIATEEPVGFHASDFGGRPPATAVFRSLDRVQTRTLSVGIKTERERVATSKWQKT